MTSSLPSSTCLLEVGFLGPDFQCTPLFFVALGGSSWAHRNNLFLRHEQHALQKDATGLSTVQYPNCFTDTDRLHEAMQRADPTVHTVFTICPGTTMKVGDMDTNGDCCTNGMMTLFAKSQTTIQCGAHGRSSDKCVLMGGNTQLMAVSSMYKETSIKHAYIKGLTFDNGDFVGVALAARGDITFEDCIFQVCLAVFLSAFEMLPLFVLYAFSLLFTCLCRTFTRQTVSFFKPTLPKAQRGRLSQRKVMT